MTDLEVAGEMHGFFQNICNTSREFITADDYRNGVCGTLELWDDTNGVHTKEEMENFFKICQVE